MCEGNASVTADFPVQRASNAENVSISWRHHVNSARQWWRHGMETLSAKRSNTPVTSRFPWQRASNTKIWFFLCFPPIEQSTESPVIWEAMTSKWWTGVRCVAIWHRIVMSKSFVQVQQPGRSVCVPVTSFTDTNSLNLQQYYGMDK